MKFIVAPAKTLNKSQTKYLKATTPRFVETSNTIIKHLQSFSKSDIKSIMKIKNTLLDETYDAIKQFNHAQSMQAIVAYNGMVYKQLHLDTYTPSELKYLNDHILILDALYGVLRPSDMIRPYRLDFTMPIKMNLRDTWQPHIPTLSHPIINIASKEFSKMIDQPMIDIKFKEKRGDTYKTIGTYAKKARGVFLDYCIRKQIQSVDDMKVFDHLNYQYNEALSSQTSLVFTRDTE